MPLQVYSTLTRKKEPFPKRPGEAVAMYVCGPTVYKPSHIGHMVGPVIFDTVKRYLTYLGYKVTWVVNVTDVDDKLIQRAKELGKTVPDLARQMTDDYFDCLAKLNVTGVDHFPRATDHIPGMVAMIAGLVQKGHAYPAAGGDVYFDVASDPDYGKLCHRDPEQMEAGARNEAGDKKRNPGDFALWKGAKPGEPAEVQFDSPWGKGRPGWHIECSAMATKLLGNTLDIHGGGLDLQFPHHENELAQSESATGVEFARVWMHNGLMQLKDNHGKPAKMAGSLGNVLNVSRALGMMSGDALRFFLLGTHYRSPIDLGAWDWEDPRAGLPAGMEAAKRAYETFLRFGERIQRVTGRTFADLDAPATAGGKREFMFPEFADLHRRFRESMDDDFNTGAATGVLFEAVGTTNRLADQYRLEDMSTTRSESGQVAFEEGTGLVKEIAGVLGLTLAAPKADLGGDLVAGLMQLLIDVRNGLRADAKVAAKDNPLKQQLFQHTDTIRKRLADLGVALEDRPSGTTWRVG